MTATQPHKQNITRSGGPIEPLLNEHQIALLCGLSAAAVRRWRLLAKGPRYIKVGASVRYRLDDLNAWLGSRPSGGEGAGAVGQ